MDDFHFEMTPNGIGSIKDIIVPFVTFFVVIAASNYVRRFSSIPNVLLFSVFVIAVMTLSVRPKYKEAVRVTVNDHELYVVTKRSRKEQNINVHEICCAKLSKNGVLRLMNDEDKTLFFVHKNFTNYDRFLQYLERSGVEMSEKQ